MHQFESIDTITSKQVGLTPLNQSTLAFARLGACLAITHTPVVPLRQAGDRRPEVKSLAYAFPSVRGCVLAGILQHTHTHTHTARTLTDPP